MKPSRRIPLLLAFAAVLSLPVLAGAQDAAPAGPAAAPESPVPAPLGGMGGEACPLHKGGDAPCMMRRSRGCRMGGSDLDDERLDALEKRMDRMQLMLETLVKQQALPAGPAD